jgi:hypothetical protein
MRMRLIAVLSLLTLFVAADVRSEPRSDDDVRPCVLFHRHG